MRSDGLKILIVCSTLDLKYKLGCTPSWWQLFKALHETGNEVIITPYLGDPVESLWWKTYENPCSFESRLYNLYLNNRIKKINFLDRETNNKNRNNIGIKFINEKWKNHIIRIMEKEKNIDALIFMNIPINHIREIPKHIRNNYSIPIIYIEGDMPTILPKYAMSRGFKFNYYVDADLSEYDLFLTNSKGVIDDLKILGAKKIFPLYYAVDPLLFTPLEIEKKIDISFFGYGSQFREEWMNKMISEPSLKMTADFVIGGKGFSSHFGLAKIIGDLTFSEFREFCCSSKICLNITRWSHATIYGSSTARPFELAGFGSCIVSQPYNGLSEWFEEGKEILIIKSNENIVDYYEALLSNPDNLIKIGERARLRVLNDHTYAKRAVYLISLIKKVRY